MSSRQDAHEATSIGDRAADGVANSMGSWRFILIQTAIVLGWMFVNSVHGWAHWDEYPYILLNLLFSTQAAYAAPIIMMSENRKAQKDRAMACKDDEQLGLLVDLQQQQMVELARLSRIQNTLTAQGRGERAVNTPAPVVAPAVSTNREESVWQTTT